MAQTKQKTACLLLTASLAIANVINITEDNYIKLTAGKNIFLVFYEPGCEPCEQILPNIEEMGKDFKDDDFALFGRVNCVAESTLCEDFDITLYPTIYFGDPLAPGHYDGEMDYESMLSFARENLSKKLCSVHNIDFCSPEQKSVIDDFKGKSRDELDDMLEEVEKQAKADEDEFNNAVLELQEQYKKLVNSYNVKIEELNQQTHYALLQSVITLKESQDNEGKTSYEL